MFPESAPKASSLDQQIAAIKIPIVKRQEFFSSYDPAIKKWGEMSAAEFKEEVDFMELSEKIKDVSGLFTNELIDEINDFDSEKIKAEAHNFKIPRS